MNQLAILVMIFIIFKIRGFEKLDVIAFFIISILMGFSFLGEKFHENKINRKYFLVISFFIILINLLLSYLIVNNLSIVKITSENFLEIFFVVYFGILFIPSVLFLTLKLKRSFVFSFSLIIFIGSILWLIEEVIFKKNYFFLVAYVLALSALIMAMILKRKQERD